MQPGDLELTTSAVGPAEDAAEPTTSAAGATAPSLEPGALMPSRRPICRRLVLALTAVALLVGLPGVAVVRLALATPAKTIALPAMPTPSPSPTVRTFVGETSVARRVVIQKQVLAATAAQSAALTARDERAFTRIAAKPAVAATLRRHYRNLIALRTTHHKVVPSFPVADSVKGQWKVSLTIEFCFVVPGCHPDRVTEASVWKDTEAGPIMIALSASPVGAGWYESPQPWELSDLSVLVGKRALVAGPAAVKSRLPAMLMQADRAAAKADGYAVGGVKPEIYRIYLAGGGEWRRWHGGQRAKWAAGFAIPTGPFSTDVVVNNAKVSASFLPLVLRHEMTHAASVYGPRYWRGNWWLVEGYAENAAHGLSWGWASATRRYADNEWKRDLPGSEPSSSASDSAAGARYGVAFLAVHRLEQRFGRAALIEFFSRVVRQGLSFETASLNVFHTGWAGVRSDLIRSIKVF